MSTPTSRTDPPTTVSTASTTTTTTHSGSIILRKIKSANLESSFQKQKQQAQQPYSTLPRPQLYSSSEQEETNKENNSKQHTLASPKSSNTNDCWQDSFEIDVSRVKMPCCKKGIQDAFFISKYLVIDMKLFLGALQSYLSKMHKSLKSRTYE